MAKYQVCPHCGSNLDFGEKCDCQDKKDNKPQHYSKSVSDYQMSRQREVFRASKRAV